MGKQLFLTALNLINFKNYSQAEISFSPYINCFIGPNGAGKTNILDAVYYLSMCKSYLNPVDRQNINFDASFFVIQSQWKRDEQVDKIYCGVKSGQKKVFKKNKVTYEKLADHIGQFPAVMISPYDRDLIIEGSTIRRKWMDGIISQFNRDFLIQLIKYGKILQQRNALLKNQFKNGFFDRESLHVWDEQLITCGNFIHQERNKVIANFIPIFQKYYQWISDSKESVGLTYQSQLSTQSFANLLRETLQKDQERQFTTVGIHKDDFIFTINGYPIKKYGSQGQQKSFLIALRLAQFEWLKKELNLTPILLLDDIFDKLDNNRVERLMQLVNEQSFGQVLITDTDEERVVNIFQRNQIDYSSFYVANNAITTKQEKMMI